MQLKSAGRITGDETRIESRFMPHKVLAAATTMQHINTFLNVSACSCGIGIKLQEYSRY
jgi:hypothetical protein